MHQLIHRLRSGVDIDTGRLDIAARNIERVRWERNKGWVVVVIPRKRARDPRSTLHFAELHLEQPKGVSCHMAGPDFADIPGIIAMLNNDTRRTVCEYLAMRPLTMRQLSEYVGVKQPTFSYHMGALFDSGLVRFSFTSDELALDTRQTALLTRYAGEVLGGHPPIRF